MGCPAIKAKDPVTPGKSLNELYTVSVPANARILFLFKLNVTVDSHLKFFLLIGVPPTEKSKPLLETDPILLRIELTPSPVGTALNKSRSVVFLS
ncbi:hypothetical protein D3C85_1511900 [compost metagenome]